MSTKFNRPTTGFAVSYGIRGEHNGKAIYRPEFQSVAGFANCRQLHLHIQATVPNVVNISVGRWDSDNPRGCWFAGAELVAGRWSGEPLTADKADADNKAKADADNKAKAKADKAKAKADTKAKAEIAKA